MTLPDWTRPAASFDALAQIVAAEEAPEWFRDSFAAHKPEDVAWHRANPDAVRQLLRDIEVRYGGYASPPCRLTGAIALAARAHDQGIATVQPNPTAAEICEAMALLPELWKFAARTERHLIETARRRGASWAEIADALFGFGGDDDGIARAHQRYQRLHGDVEALDRACNATSTPSTLEKGHPA